MANQDINNGANNPEVTPEQTQGEQATMAAVPQKTGFGTALKIGAGLLFGAAFTGLGWILRGVLGGRDDEDDETAASAEHPNE